MSTYTNGHDLARALNWRDLGGLATAGGKTIAPRRLYRSGELSRVNPQMASSLRDIGLRTVVDLRMSSELGTRRVEQLLPSAKNLHRPLFETARPDWANPIDRSAQATADRYLEMLEEGAPTIVQIIKELGDSNTYPAVIHCAVGRDRTGIVVACLLSLLGVSDENIAADYALSPGDNGHVDPKTMMNLLALIRQKHGSMRHYLLNHGCSDEALTGIYTVLLSRRPGGDMGLPSYIESR